MEAQISSGDEITDEMLILSNRSGMFGAATLFLPGLVERIHERFMEVYFAILLFYKKYW